jgi:hypothetical protein
MKVALKGFRVLLYMCGAAALACSARAAIGEQVWLQRYNGPANGSENAFAIVADGGGNVFVTGSSGGSAGLAEYATIKYSEAGVALWTNRYHGPGTGSDGASAMAVDRNGDVIVTGYSSGSGSSSDYATIKYSGAGVPLWTNRYTSLGDSARATAVAADTNGNVFVTGYSYFSGLATIKYSSAGVALWTNRYIGPAGGNDYASGIAVDGNGNAFVTGSSTGIGSGDDVVTLAYSNGGAPWWTNRYNGAGNGDDEGNAIALDASGNVFVTGGAIVGGLTAFVTFKYSNAGIPLWTNYYSGAGNSPYGGASDIAVDGAGNVVITGTSVGSGTYQDFATIKYSNAGVPLWTNRYNRMYDDAAIAIATDRSGNVFVTGYTTDDSFRFDRLTIGYSSAGAPLWTNRYNGPGNNDDSGNALTVDANGNLFVTGYSYGTNNNPDFTTIKYSGVQPIPLSIQATNNSVVLTWPNATFHLQSAPVVSGNFTNVPSATSPYTNPPTAAPRYFRLRLN